MILTLFALVFAITAYVSPRVAFYWGLLIVGYLVLTSLAIAITNLRGTYRSVKDDQSPSRGRPMALTRRNYHFFLEKTDPESVFEWNPNGRFIALFMAALSIFFPAGERMFCNAVQAHKNHPNVAKNPVLQTACASFVSQESVHGREHDCYNDQIYKQFPLTRRLESLVKAITWSLFRFLPVRGSLSITMCLEHWTAIMADFLLDNQQQILGSDETRFAMVWMWHACEETEHKAVAYDCYEAVYGAKTVPMYLVRCCSMIVTSFIFWSLVFTFHFALVLVDGSIFNLGEWKNFLYMLFYRPGLFTGIFPAYCDFFRFEFHPWDHQNSDKIARMSEFEAKLKQFKEIEDKKTGAGRDTPKGAKISS